MGIPTGFTSLWLGYFMCILDLYLFRAANNLFLLFLVEIVWIICDHLWFGFPDILSSVQKITSFTNWRLVFTLFWTVEQCGGEYCFVEYFELEWYFFYLTPTLGKWTHTTLKIRGFEKILNLNLIISLRKQNKGLEPIRIFRIPFWKDNTKNICAFLNFFRLFWNMIGDYIWGLRTFLSSFLIEISNF